MREINPHRKDDILAAALKVFGEKGYLSSSNKDIARAAGMRSAALIYHYFENREDLLRQVIERYHPAARLLLDREAFLALDLEQALTLFASELLSISAHEETVLALRVIMSEAMRDPHTAERIYQILPQPVFQLLKELFSSHISRGHIRPDPPEQLVCKFVGPLLMSIFVQSVFKQTLCSFEASAYVSDYLAAL
ncbi:MAG: TetR/AcrR family transcriptional regulator [bacterium]|nr:TetR/AcrR family transcriptional regulator [bacterium]